MKRKTPMKRTGFKRKPEHKRLSPVSEKRKIELDAYGIIKELIFSCCKVCAVCNMASPQDLHHPYGRGRGKFIWKTLCVMPVCRQCHDRIHEHPNEARKTGLLNF